MSDVIDRTEHAPQPNQAGSETPLEKGGVLNWINDHKGRIAVVTGVAALIGGAYGLGANKNRQAEQNNSTNPGTVVSEQTMGPTIAPSPKSVPGLPELDLGRACSSTRELGEIAGSAKGSYYTIFNRFFNTHGQDVGVASPNATGPEWVAAGFQRTIGHKDGYGIAFQDAETGRIEVTRLDETLLTFDGQNRAKVYIPLDGNAERVMFVKYLNDMPNSSIATTVVSFDRATVTKAAGQGGSGPEPCLVTKKATATQAPATGGSGSAENELPKSSPNEGEIRAMPADDRPAQTARERFGAAVLAI